MRGLKLTLAALAVSLFGLPSASGQEAVEKGWLGVRFEPGERGVHIRRVYRFSPAESAGIKAKDSILSINGKPATATGLANVLRSSRVGQALNFQVLRGEATLDLSITLVAKDLESLGRQALAAGAKALAARQREDGGWRRQERDVTGAGITALIAKSLAELPESVRAPFMPMLNRAIEYLTSHMNTKGIVLEEADAIQPYANFATALFIDTLLALGRKPDDPVIQKLVAGLLDSQLDEGEKFSVYDFQYGSWDFNDINERRRVRVNVMISSYVVTALIKAGVALDSPTLKRARAFMLKCQNWEEDPDPIMAPLLDGGFIESPRESKAGLQQIGPEELVYRSTGTNTADGLRTLLALGLEKDSARIEASRKWLGQRFRLDLVPGYDERPAVRFDRGLLFYYLNSVARCYESIGEPVVKHGRKFRLWTVSLIDFLTRLQDPEGLWANPVDVMGEHVPELATAFAIQTLNTSLRNYPEAKKILERSRAKKASEEAKPAKPESPKKRSF